MRHTRSTIKAALGIALVLATSRGQTHAREGGVPSEATPAPPARIAPTVRAIALEPGAQRPAAVAPVSAEQAISAARSWLDALKGKDRGAVSNRSRLPFTFKTTSRKKTCEGIAADAKKLGSVVACLKRDTLLMEELAYAEDLDFKAVELQGVPSSLRPLVGKMKAGERLAYSFINGDGVAFEFVFLVASGEGGVLVRAVLMHVEVESG